MLIRFQKGHNSCKNKNSANFSSYFFALQNLKKVKKAYVTKKMVREKKTAFYFGLLITLCFSTDRFFCHSPQVAL